jgi:putative addiction module CopG family antidote
MSTTLNVCINGPLEEFVKENIGEHGTYENASEYVRDLIRRDREEAERAAFAALKAELKRAFAQPDSAFIVVTREEVIARNVERHRG